jgi:hypothetical protein
LIKFHSTSFLLSRSIYRLVSQGHLSQIKGTTNVRVPSHSFYADDLMIFCKGNLSGLRDRVFRKKKHHSASYIFLHLEQYQRRIWSYCGQFFLASRKW